MRTAKIWLTLAIVAMLTAGAFAQAKQKNQKKGGGAKVNPVTQTMVRLGKMHDALQAMDLSDEQKAKLKELQESVEPKMRVVMEPMKEILGEEKMNEIREVTKKAKEAGKSTRQIAVAVEKALKLNDDQKKEIDKIGKELAKLQREITKGVNGLLTPDQKKELAAKMRPQRRKGKDKKK